MNYEAGGFDCPGCAGPDDPDGLHLDPCENGVKHVTWELAPAKADGEFFGAHTVSELAQWSDYDLEAVGRLAEPLSYNPATDKYEPISWEDAFALVGGTLRGLASPHQASFYTSGRLSNEATFLYQLWVREFGTNNLPDCSNMCHEASGRALTATLGTGKGTVDLRDWQAADAIWLLGDNAASNAPRMLTWLAEADRRGAQLIHINPLIEAGSRRTIVPHEFEDMATFHTTSVGTMRVQVRIREAVDATDPGAARSAVDRLAADVGPPDILVNTIGTFHLGDAVSTTPEELHLIVDVNLGPALWLSQAVAPHMQRQGSGAIVHVSARPGIEPTPGMAAYSLSKAALVYLTRILDLELRPQGIRVNAVAPQLLNTPANKGFPPDLLAHAVAPEAIADVIAFLVSAAAAPVSGAILPAYGA